MTQADAAARRRLLAFAALAVTMLLWSGNMIVGRALSSAVPPFLLALIRWVGALAIVLPFAWRHLIADRAAIVAGWRPILLLGLTGIACFNAFVYSGLHYTTAANAALLQAAIPPLVLGIDRLLFGLRSTAAQVVGVLLASAGVVVIVCQGSLAHLLGLHFGIGDLLVLCGVVAWALYTSLLRLRPAIHASSFLAVTFAIGVATMAPLAATEAAEIAAVEWDIGVVAGCAYLAIFPSVVAYSLYNGAVAEVGAGLAGQAISLLPLFGALLAVPTLGEPLHGYHGAGMALIAAGIAAGWLARGKGPG